MTPLTVEFLGHSSFCFRHPSAGTVYVDPWLTGNPTCKLTLQEITEADCVCVSHGHRDHLGDAIPICQRTGATLISTPEICAYASRQGIPYEKQSHGLNIGGTARRLGLSVTMVHAFHTSEIQGQRYHVDRSLEPGSGAAGFILDFGGEHCVYYTGDTGVFGDMRLFAELYKPALIILPVGGKYTMGPREAAKALELTRPSFALPCHHGTYPGQAVDLEAFARLTAAASPSTRLVLLQPGESFLLESAPQAP